VRSRFTRLLQMMAILAAIALIGNQVAASTHSFSCAGHGGFASETHRHAIGPAETPTSGPGQHDHTGDALPCHSGLPGCSGCLGWTYILIERTPFTLFQAPLHDQPLRSNETAVEQRPPRTA
jgi:hypothetical protein